MPTWIFALGLAIVSLIALEEYLVLRRGDCWIDLEAEHMEQKKLIRTGVWEVTLSFVVNFRNTGKQQGLLIDCSSQVQPETDIHRGLRISTRLINLANPRDDGYWEACIIKPGGVLPVRIDVNLASSEEAATSASWIPEAIFLDLYYKFYCRTPLIYRHTILKMVPAQFEEEKAQPREIPVPSRPFVDRRDVIPLHTHLLRSGDDPVEIVKRYAKDLTRPGDIIAIAESALAIMQGRACHIEEIKPRYLARKINRLFDKDSSLSSVYSLEMAFREVGVPRILVATITGVVGKLLGRKGIFYKVAGRAVATIDDCTGTIPPYDKYVVLGPKEPDEVVRKLKEETGIEAAVVDVNDLGKVDILASTCPQHTRLIIDSLCTNPQGNANEQTPLVLIRINGDKS